MRNDKKSSKEREREKKMHNIPNSGNSRKGLHRHFTGSLLVCWRSVGGIGDSYLLLLHECQFVWTDGMNEFLLRAVYVFFFLFFKGLAPRC